MTATAPISWKKAISWSFYDWANSAFATTVMAGFFPIFYANYWREGVEKATSTSEFNLANSFSSILVAVLAPILGAIADRGGAKKPLLLLFAIMGAFATAMLAGIGKDSYVAVLAVYTITLIGFSGANIFYDSLIVDVTDESRIDFVSAMGYSLGYLGGGLLFALNVYMTLNPGLFGLVDKVSAVKASFVTVGVWWFVFTLPLMFFVREARPAHRPPVATMVAEGIRQVLHTFAEIRRLRNVLVFIVGYVLYIDGVNTVIRVATIYGNSLSLDPGVLMKALLMVQFIGFPAAIVFGKVGEKIGARRSLLIAIGCYIVVVIWAAFLKSETEFYMLAGFVGLVQGGIQSLSRSFFARLIPRDKAGEFFGFYNMVGKFSAILGPTLMAVVTWLALHAFGSASETAQRVSIASIAILFIAGGSVLFFVKEHEESATA